MNLSGKNINNNYIIREKITEDSISTTWLAHSIFSVKKYFLKFFKKNIFEFNLENLALIKKEIFDSKIIKNEKILNPVELDEYEGNFFMAIEGQEGETLYDYLKKNSKIDPDNIFKILLKIASIVKEFHDNNEYLCFISCKDILIESYYNDIQYVRFVNFKYPVIIKYFSLKEYNNIKKFLLKSDEKENILNNQRNDLIMLGILFYSILSLDFEFKKIDNNIDKIQDYSFESMENKSKYIKIVSRLLDKGSYYKDISNLIKELSDLKEVKKDITNNKKKPRDANQDIFEDRRNYFEKLENERKKRLEQSNSEVSHVTKTENEKELQEYNKKLFEERRDYFEKYEKERWDYLRKSSNNNTKHLDDLIDKTKTYLVNLQDKNKISKDSIKHKEYFEELSKKMKGYADNIKEDNIKYFEKVIKNKDSGKGIKYNLDRLNYLEKRILEAKNNLNNLSEKTKEYFLDITNEAKKQINKELKDKSKIKSNEVNNIINDTLDYYHKIEEESNVLYKKIIKNSKKSNKKKGIKKPVDASKKVKIGKKKGNGIKRIDVISIKTLKTRKNKSVNILYFKKIKTMIFKILFYFKRLFLKNLI